MWWIDCSTGVDEIKWPQNKKIMWFITYIDKFRILEKEIEKTISIRDEIKTILGLSMKTLRPRKDRYNLIN